MYKNWVQCTVPALFDYLEGGWTALHQFLKIEISILFNDLCVWGGGKKVGKGGGRRFNLFITGLITAGTVVAQTWKPSITSVETIELKG